MGGCLGVTANALHISVGGVVQGVGFALCLAGAARVGAEPLGRGGYQVEGARTRSTPSSRADR